MASTLAIFMIRSLPDGAAEKGHAFDPEVDLDQPAGHRGAGSVKRSHVAAVQRAALAEYAIRVSCRRFEELDVPTVLGVMIDAARGDSGDPEVAVRVDLQPSSGICRSMLDDRFDDRPGCGG